jgi:hypothetical protein
LQLSHEDLNLKFLFPAFIYGKMFRVHMDSVVMHPSTYKPKETYGNKVVYGSAFYCSEEPYLVKVLDSAHSCFYNHELSMQFKQVTNIYPIQFNSIADLDVLKYTESEPIQGVAYFGNYKHKRIYRRMQKNVPSARYRITNGCNKVYVDVLKQLYLKEV